MDTEKNGLIHRENVYEAPEINVIEVQCEGILCQSFSNAEHDGYTEEDFIW